MTNALENYIKEIDAAGYVHQEGIELVVEHSDKFILVCNNVYEDGYIVGIFYKGDCTKTGHFGGAPLFEAETLSECLNHISTSF